MKEKLTVSIDGEVMKTAREHIPNMSKFIEDCLKSYLMIGGMNKGERGQKLRMAWDTFKHAQLEIHMLTEVNYEDEILTDLQERQKSTDWLKAWGEYRWKGSAQEYKIEEAAKALNLELDVMKQLLHDTYREFENDKTKAQIYDSWSYIEENILPYVEVEDEEEFDIDAILAGEVEPDW